MIPFMIDGQPVEGKEGGNVLEVALDAGIEIPHLCYNESVKPYGACRLCLVEVVRNGRSRMTPPAPTRSEGIEVLTQTEKVLRARRMMIELILAMCPGDTRIQDMAKEMGVQEVRFKKEEKDCILCGLCARVCDEVVGAHAIQFCFPGRPEGDDSSLCRRGHELYRLRGLCGRLSGQCDRHEGEGG